MSTLARIAADNDPRNGSLVARLLRMGGEPGREPDKDGLYRDKYAQPGYADRLAGCLREREPSIGTRVLCHLPNRGEQGEVVAWDEDLNLPLITWDALRSEEPEACEPHEYEVIV